MMRPRAARWAVACSAARLYRAVAGERGCFVLCALPTRATAGERQESSVQQLVPPDLRLPRASASPPYRRPAAGPLCRRARVGAPVVARLSAACCAEGEGGRAGRPVLEGSPPSMRCCCRPPRAGAPRHGREDEGDTICLRCG
eukprot:scaffold995_cov242-Prasinococcus_capsulatus_cf.AAC.1